LRSAWRRFLGTDLGTKLCETLWNRQDVVKPAGRLTVIEPQF